MTNANRDKGAPQAAPDLVFNSNISKDWVPPAAAGAVLLRVIRAVHERELAGEKEES